MSEATEPKFRRTFHAATLVVAPNTRQIRRQKHFCGLASDCEMTFDPDCGGEICPFQCFDSSSSSARFKYVDALGKIITGDPYPPSNAIIYMHLQL